MILIADSGSTKTDWAVLDEKGTEIAHTYPGDESFSSIVRGDERNNIWGTHTVSAVRASDRHLLLWYRLYSRPDTTDEKASVGDDGL